MKWIEGVPPLNELKEEEVILVMYKFEDGSQKPFVSEYAHGCLHDMYDREPFFEGNVTKWARIEEEPEQKYYFVNFMYGASQKTHENLVIELHPLVWQKKVEKTYPGQYVLLNWQEISQEEYSSYFRSK